MNYPYTPIKVIKLDGGTLVIYDWDQLSSETSPKIWENVQFFDGCNRLLWTVHGMNKYPKWNRDLDVFVGARSVGGRFQLISFSGNSYDFDLNTGSVKFAEFHK